MMDGTMAEGTSAGPQKGGPRKKRDNAPRGVRKHPSGVWAIRYSCGIGCVHKERIGPIKGDAVHAYHARRRRAHEELGWCLSVERSRQQERLRAEQERQARRLTFRAYAEEYVTWAELHHRGVATERSRISVMVTVFGGAKLDTIAPADVERFLDGLLAERSHATVNRYRTTLHAMFNRAIRHGLLSANQAKGPASSRRPRAGRSISHPRRRPLSTTNVVPTRPQQGGRRSTPAGATFGYSSP